MYSIKFIDTVNTLYYSLTHNHITAEGSRHLADLLKNGINISGLKYVLMSIVEVAKSFYLCEKFLVLVLTNLKMKVFKYCVMLYLRMRLSLLFSKYQRVR